MLIRSGVISLLCFLSLAASAQIPAKPATSEADHSQEAFVIEKFSRAQKFENDGTSSMEDSARIRIQSEAGVQQYGVLDFSYASATSTLDIVFVRVHKPDGSVIETPAENVQDVTPQITREAPFYSDLHEKHVAVKGLSAGDVLEFRTLERTAKPLAPGQFWTQYAFTHTQIVLDEDLEISVPRDRSVKLKSTAIQPGVTEAGAYRVYTWHTKNLHRRDESNKREATEELWQQARGRTRQPDLLMSSFSSWEEVGRWYDSLQAERVKPTTEVAQKAAELTANSADADAKIRALYDYVSTQFHYIGVSFGIGRYQPHSAAAVFENQYGDCKDKHTLLASLLSAVGIQAYPALISASREVDADVPSPGQFDHVITVVPRDSTMIWLDTTAEVGPYRYLLPPLRDKQALVIWKDKPPELVRTASDLPYASSQTFNMDAKLNDAGLLVGNAEFSARGDVEYFLRAGFRAVALTQWKDLAQRISAGMGFGGEVSEVNASSPEHTDQSFHFSYKYTRKDFGDWPNRRILAPEPIISLTGPADEELLPLGPIWLGPPTDILFRSQVELPAGSRIFPPAAVHLKWDFAQFDATYEFKDGKMLSQRHLKTLMQEVPAGEREQYKQLAKAVLDDYGLFIPLVSGSGSPTSGGDLNSPTMSSLRSLPDSTNEEAARLETEAKNALAKHDMQTAVSSLYRAVAADPKFVRAWVILGGLLLMQRQTDAGIDAFHKAIAADPSLPAIPKALGYSLMAADHCEEAVPVWQEYSKAHPDDGDGPSNLGTCLSKLKRYSEAAAAFEAAIKVGGDRQNLQANLGTAYLQAGDRDKAVDAFSKLPSLDPTANNLNNVAYQMANADLKLPLALDFAKQAVQKIEGEAQKTALPDLTLPEFRRIFALSAYWDTLGWVYERMSDLPRAEQYLRASWKLSQDGVVAGHLCHLYRRTHQTASGIQMCRMAIFRIPLSGQLTLGDYKTELDAAKENLDYLTKGSAQSSASSDASGLVVRERMYKMPRFLPGTESAEFFVLMASDGKGPDFKVEDVKFISGSDKMKSQGKQLKTVNFNFKAPDNAASRFVIRGILGCYQYTGCSFVVLDPSSVNSVN